MKEFEKQWACGMLSGSPTSFNSGASAKEAAQFNWQAPLKWVKEFADAETCTRIDEELQQVKNGN